MAIGFLVFEVTWQRRATTHAYRLQLKPDIRRPTAESKITISEAQTA